MNTRHSLVLSIARNTLILIKEERDSGRLRRLADLTLALKPILDELPDFPDLGLELREYAVLKRDTGPSTITEKFRLSLEAMLEPKLS